MSLQPVQSMATIATLSSEGQPARAGMRARTVHELRHVVVVVIIIVRALVDWGHAILIRLHTQPCRHTAALQLVLHYLKQHTKSCGGSYSITWLHCWHGALTVIHRPMHTACLSKGHGRIG